MSSSNYPAPDDEERRTHLPLPAALAHAGDGVVGQSPGMQEVYKAIGRAASQTAPVLITGESGTGKKLIARTIQRWSARAAQPCYTVHCGLPEALARDELFGEANRGGPGGKLEQARGGTLILQEIGGLSPRLQADLLLALAPDVRLIATATSAAAQPPADRTFLQWFERRHGSLLNLPPLRERKEDLLALTQHFLQRYNVELGTTVRRVAPDAIRRLEARNWPGNVRELELAVKHALLNSVGPMLSAADFPADEVAASVSLPAAEASADSFAALSEFAQKVIDAEPGDAYRRITNAVDSVVIDVALRSTKGNQLHAARLLGISRTTLRAKLRLLGFSIEKQWAAGEKLVAPKPDAS